MTESYNQNELVTIDKFEDLLGKVLGLKNKQNKVALSLRQICSLQKIKQHLDRFPFLNTIFKEDLKLRSQILSNSQEDENLEKELYRSLENKINNFITDIRVNLDKLRIWLLNQTMTKEVACEFLKNLGSLTFKCEEFSILYKKNKSVSFFSTMKSFINIEPNEETLNEIIQEFQASDAATNKRQLIEVTNSAEKPNPVWVEKLSELLGSNKYFVLNHSFKENRALIILQNIVEDGSRLLYENIHENTLMDISKLFYELAVEIQVELFSKYHVCDVLDMVRNSLINNAKDICSEIIRTECQNKLQTSVELIKENHPLFSQFEKLTSGKYQLHLEGNKLVLPVRELSSVAFYISIKQAKLDLFYFIDECSKKWNLLSYTLKSLKARRLFLELIEKDKSRLLLIFNSNLELCFQNREIPTKLKDYIELVEPFDDYQANNNFAKIFSKNSEFHESVFNSYEVLKSSQEKTITSNGSKPFFEMAIRRNTKGKLVELVISIENIKDKVSKLENEDERKLQKLLDKCLEKRSLSKNISWQEIIDLIKDKSIEKAVKSPFEEKEMDELRETYVSEYIDNRSPPSVIEKKSKFPTVKEKFHYHDEEQKDQSSKLLTNLHSKMNNYGNFKPKKSLFVMEENDLETVMNWNLKFFDMDIEEKYRLVWFMFHSLNYIEKFEIDLETFGRFIVVLQEKYNCRNNPFHNFEHGLTVCHAAYYFLKINKHLMKFLSVLDCFTLILSALCHDVDHTGRTNLYEIASLSKLAIKYHDESVLEQHHAACTIKLLSNDKTNILANISAANYRYIRKFLISNVLATDMKKHFDILRNFEHKLSEFNQNPSLIESSEVDKKLLTGIIVHTVDLSGAAKHWTLANTWSKRICSEFNMQVEDEKRNNLEITPFMKGLEKLENIAKQEIGFIKAIIKPIWETMNNFMGGALQVCVDAVNNNSSEWEKVYEAEMKK